MLFSHEHALELKDKLDYRKFYRQYLQLSSFGEWLQSNCPFHDDKNPSFYIHEKTGIWHCKSNSNCGSGDVIKFYQKITGKSFDEAIQDIADSQDIKLEISEEYRKKIEKQKQIYQVNEYISKLYMKSLSQNKDGQNYLMSRNFTMDIIKKFKIGYIPGFDLKQINSDLIPYLEYAGLLKKNNEGSLVNYFDQRRISIPFQDSNGNIVGFSSRVIDKDIKPKYIHTRNSEIFQMPDLLFGFNFAKSAIQESKSVILTEGQFDCIRAHQYEIENCVAMCGLKLSEKQVKLFNNVKNFYIILEDDAAEQALDRLYETIIKIDYYSNVKVIKLYKNNGKNKEDKCDLDDFLIQNGKGAFLEKIKNAHTYNEHKLIDSISHITYKNIEEKKKHIYVNRKYILGIKNAIDRNQYIELLAKKLEIPETDIRRIISRAEVEDSYTSTAYDEKKDNRVYVSQLYILATFFANNFTTPDIYSCLNNLKVKNKLNNNFKKIFEKICDCILTKGSNCDIMNMLYSSNVLNEDELEILTEAFMKHDDLDYLEEKDELVSFLEDQINNLK